MPPREKVKQVSRYRILQLLGEGGMGQVYLAQDQANGEKVALKFLLSNLQGSARRFFQEEVKLLSRLSHPNLVKIFDYLEDASEYCDRPKSEDGVNLAPLSGPFFSMEFIAGQTLETWAPQAKTEQWIDLLAQLSQGLHYLHARNILHRDLKPSNILWTETGLAKILDFGLSTTLHNAAAEGKARGTLPYLAPEVFRGNYDFQSDLFSLGVLLYECLTGRLPYTKPFGISGQRVEKPRPLQDYRPELPEYFCDILHSLLAPKVEERPRSALAVLRFLNQHLAQPYPEIEQESAELVLQKVPLVGRETEEKKFWDFAKGGGATRYLQLTGPTGVGRSRFLEEMKWKFQFEGIPFLALTPDNARNWHQTIFEYWSSGRLSDDPQDWIFESRAFFEQLKPRRRVLAFQDLHAWPEEILQDLQLFLRLLKKSASPFLVIAEFNSDLESPSLSGLGGSFAEGISRSTLALGDLAPDQARKLLELATLDASLPTDRAEKILAGAGGRPLLLLEALRQILTGKTEEAFLPKGLQEVAEHRIRNLSAESKILLALILVHPERLELSEAAACYPPGDTKLEDALLDLDQKGFTARRLFDQPYLTLAQPSLNPIYLSALPQPAVLEGHRRWLKYFLSRSGAIPQSGPASLNIAQHAWSLGEKFLAKNWGFKAAETLEQAHQLKEAIDWYRKVLTVAETDVERYTAYGSAAPMLYRLGRFDEALEAYDLWFKHRDDDESLLQKVKHRFFTGLVLFAAGREGEARERMEECVATSDSLRYPALRLYHARARAFLAALEEKAGNFSKAQEHLDLAHELAEGKPLLLGEIEQRLGELHLSALQMEAALLSFEQSRKHYAEAKSPQAEAVAVLLIARAQQEMGHLVEALEKVNLALELSRKSGQVLQAARTLENRGLIHLAMGDYSQAMEDMEEARDVLEVLGTEEDQRLIEVHWAELSMYLGNLDRTEIYFKKLVADRKSLEGMGLWFSVLHKRGEFAYLNAQYDEARQYFLRALDLAKGKLWGLRSLELRLALLRSLARLGALEKSDPILQETLTDLAALPGPLFSVWKKAFEILSGESEAEPDRQALKGLFADLEKIRLPEIHRDVYELLAIDQWRRGLKESAARLQELGTSVWQEILENLKEELKMDFEKNRESQSLDESISEIIPRPKAKAARTEAPAEVRPPEKSQPSISELRFRQYSEINRQISQKYDLNEILERVMDAAIELTGAERGFLLLKNEKAKKKPFVGYEVKSARRISHQSLEEEDFQVSLSALQEAVTQGKPMMTSDALSDERLRSKKSVMQFQLKSIMVVPMDVEGEVIGAIYLDHRFHPACFNEEDATFLSAFASQAALAVQKAWIVEDLKKAKQNLENKVEDQAQHIQSLSGELDQVRDQLRYGYEEIVGKSPPMMQVFKLLDHVTDTMIPVWILGESGTGKELVARSLHFNSARKQGPFVSENCSSIPETLLESELFGHKKGSFTHADRDRVGLFEQADGGTLFLDEVADMSLAMQAKLLRVLQEGEIRPVGSSKKIKIDVRLVTASNKDLEKLVQEEKFREDLLYRINGLTIPLPPLRDRREDIPLLISYLIKKISRDFKLQPSEVSDESFQILMDFGWPGNIRQLEAVIRNALLFARGRLITPEVLSMTKGLVPRAGGPGAPAATGPVSTPEDQSQAERQMILDALRKNKMNKRLAAEELGVSLRSLYIRMDRHGIPKNKPVLAKYLGLKV